MRHTPENALRSPAGRPGAKSAGHRFGEFTGGFATWVIFHGPEGGVADRK